MKYDPLKHDGKNWPDGLTHLSLNGGTLPEGTRLPDGLTYLSLGGGTLPEGTRLPPKAVIYP